MDAKSDYRRSIRFKIKHKSGRRAPVRVLGFVAVLAIMFAMIAPLAPLSQSAAAADDQTEEVAQPEETVQEDPYTGGIYLTKYVCEEDYGGDPYQLYEKCQVSYDFGFEVYGPEYQQYFEGDISASGLAAGGYGIQEYVPEGYGNPIAFCGIGPSDGGTPSYNPVDVYDGYYEFHLDYNQSIYCDWFNIEYQEEHHDEEYGSLTIYKYFCPGESEYDFYSADSSSLQDACEFYGDSEVGFDLYHDETGETESRYTGSGSDGSAYWEQVPGGHVTVSEYAWDGYGKPVIYCGVVYGDSVEFFEVNAYDWSAGFEFPYGEHVVCFWFNIPEYDEYGSLTIYKYFCPEAYEGDYYASEADHLREYCEYYDGHDVGFDLYSSETDETETRYTGDGDGGAYWDQVPGGHVEVTEYAQEGYGTPVIFCAVYYGEEYEWFPVDISDWTAGFEFPYGKDVVCFWFNIPEHDDYGDVTIYKYFCEELKDFDPYSASYYDLVEYCEQYHGQEVLFSLYQGDQGANAQYTGYTDDGSAYWGDVAGGDLRIVEDAWEGYGKPVIFCYSYDPTVNGTSEFTPVDVSEYGFDYYLDHGYSLVCAWFNIPEYDEYGTITIYKYFCPEEYEFDYYGAELEYLKEYCEGYHGDEVTFDLYDHDSGETETRATGTGDGGSAYWDEVYGGEKTITEYGPAGYGAPVVYCDIYYTFDEEVPVYERYEVEGSSISGYLDAGYHLVCYWFNIPEYEDEYSDLYLVKWICPEGYGYEDLYDYELHELQELCTYAFEGVDFELDGPDGYNEGRTTDSNGEATWDELELGEYELKEYVPDGYGEPIVWCGFSAIYDGAVYDGFPQRVELSGGDTYEFEIGVPNSSYFCYWFNIPDYEDDGKVVVKKWVCPEGYDYYELSLDELYEYCDQVLAHVDFHLIYGEEDSEKETDDSGEASWDELAPGSYGLYEEIPDGYGEPIVYCWPSVVEGDLGYATSPERYELIEGYGIEFEIEYGMTWYCDWFNIPYEDDNTVYVKKWICPDGYDVYDLTYEELKELCHEVYEGVDFTLTDGEDFTTKTTDNDGETAWTGLTSGEYGLYEEVPSGYGQPIFFCGWTNEYEDEYQDPEWWKLYSFDGNPGIKWTFEGYGHYLYCDVFNVPYEDEDGSITIYKWLCPEGYDLYDEYANPWEDCTKAYEGVTFEIEGPDGYDDTQKTGDDIPGGVYWDELESGDYEIKEKLPNGIAYGFVLECEGGYFPETYPLYTTESGKAFELYLDYGQHIVCDWFNVPYEDQHKDDDGTLTVYKYWCEGDYVSDYNCELYGGGQKFELTPAGGGEAIEFVTGGNGKKTLTVGAGEWELDEIGAEWCLAESPDVNGDGYLETKKGHESVVKVYNCGKTPPDGGKQPPTKNPPTKMPNTGSGAAADSLGSLTVAGMTGGAETLGLMLAAGQLVGLAGLALHRARRNRTGGETEVRPAA